MKELYLFILWHNARDKEEVILNDISQKFEVSRVFDVKWSEELFAQNLARLYGKKLKKTYKKMRQVGNDRFLLVTVYDNNPIYTTDGKNLNILKAKSEYRALTGGGHLVHASDNPEETEENLLLILGNTIKEFEKSYKRPFDGSVNYVKKDPIATKGWKNENLLMKFIDKIDNCSIEKSGKRDIIKTTNAGKIRRLINATPLVFNILNLYHVPIKGDYKTLKIENIRN